MFANIRSKASGLMPRYTAFLGTLAALSLPVLFLGLFSTYTVASFLVIASITGLRSDTAVMAALFGGLLAYVDLLVVANYKDL